MLKHREKSIRWSLYSAFARRWMGRFRRVKELELEKLVRISRGPGLRVVWFHGASVGELEALVPVVERWLAASPKHRAVVTAFSPSARQLLDRLDRTWREQFSSEAFCIGFSPREGDWLECLRAARPETFLTYRYEAWPDLWASLASLSLPLWVIAARDRRSLRWINPVLRGVLGVATLPRILWGHVPAESRPVLLDAGLRVVFKDPRWDRVEQRRRLGSARAQEWVRWATGKGAPRPWAVLGNVWSSDHPVIESTLAQTRDGVLWVVPHQIDAPAIDEWMVFFRTRKIEPIRSSLFHSPQMPESHVASGQVVVLVDEFGWLAELYAAGDWAYVGGGFGVSIHSLLEPAIHGIPLICGPRGVERFPETELLQGRGQLSVCRSAEELEQWVRNAPSQRGDSSAFRRLIEENDLGGAQQIVQALLDRRG